MKKIITLLLLLSMHATCWANAEDKIKSLESLSNEHNAAEGSISDKQLAEKKSAASKYYGGNGAIRCGSSPRSWQHCYADTRYGMRLVRELSRNHCRNNWGYDAYGVWVANGCQAEFRSDRYQHHWGNEYQREDFVRCQSFNYRRESCRVGNLHNAEVHLIHQLGRHSCRNNWGHDNNAIWVKNGCKADFYVYRHRPSWGGGDPGYGDPNDSEFLLCESRGGYSQYCNTPSLAEVTLVEVLNHDARECDGNWGYDNRGIWVNNGCRARFEITTFEDAFPSRPDYGSGHTSRKVKCKSRNNRLKICNVRNFERVELIREISKGKYPCEGNWGVNRNGELYVTNNCYAEFRVWQ